VIWLVRLRSASEQPIARLSNYLLADLPGLTTEALQERGLYQLIRACGVQLHAAVQTIGARNATTAEARLLGESRGAAVLTMLPEANLSRPPAAGRGRRLGEGAGAGHGCGS
jgi:GntR family transcriptional regulator